MKKFASMIGLLALLSCLLPAFAQYETSIKNGERPSVLLTADADAVTDATGDVVLTLTALDSASAYLVEIMVDGTYATASTDLQLTVSGSDGATGDIKAVNLTTLGVPDALTLGTEFDAGVDASGAWAGSQFRCFGYITGTTSISVNIATDGGNITVKDGSYIKVTRMNQNSNP